MNDAISRVREIADQAMVKTIGPGFIPANNVVDALLSIPWKDLCTGSFSQQEMATMNLELDPRSCLGRIALMLAIVEKYFPELMAQTCCAEVTGDFFRELMLQQWKSAYHPGNPPSESWLAEFLMYEEPHAILTINGRQLDPLFFVYAEETKCPLGGLAHPAVREFSPWEAVATFRMVSEALMKEEIAEGLEKLREAETICPGTCLVRQNLVGFLAVSGAVFGSEDKTESVRQILLDLCEIAPSVRALALLRSCFGSAHPAQNQYDPHLLALLEVAVWRSVS